MNQQCKKLRYKELDTKLIAPEKEYDYLAEPLSYNHFGASVAVAGTRVAVGVRYDDKCEYDSGNVRIYEWNGDWYVKVSRVFNYYSCLDRSLDVDGFASAVALSGDGTRLVVGAYRADTTAGVSGMVYVYSWDSAVSAYKEVLQLVASDAGQDDSYGSSVAISDTGDTIAVGAEDKDTVSDCAGKVYIYKRDSATSVYVEVAQLVAPDAAAYDYFGSAVAMSGSRLVVGARAKDTASDRAGKVYIYEWDSDTSAYIEVSQLVAPDAAANDWFGSSVAMSGSRLVVVAGGKATVSDRTGKVYVYEWDKTTSTYVEVVALVASTSGNHYEFGTSIAVDGDRLMIGALDRNIYETTIGKVYLYDLQSGNEEQ